MELGFEVPQDVYIKKNQLNNNQLPKYEQILRNKVKKIF